MDYRNKLGMFSFDDGVQESSMKLIVQNVTGQYLNPKKGEPELTDEQSCYDFIFGCGNVLGNVPFSLEINPELRVWTAAQLKAKKIADFDARIKEGAISVNKAKVELGKLFGEEKPPMVRGAEKGAAFAGWLVGPAAVA